MQAGSLVTAAAYGWTGKLPAHGDFITGGAYSPFLRGITDWLHEGMAAARRIGLDLDPFLTSPFVRVAAARGVFAENGGLALFGPGMDAGGRAFPFAIVVEATEFRPTPLMLEDQTFTTMEALFLDVLTPEKGQAVLEAASPPRQFPSNGESKGAGYVRREGGATSALPSKADSALFTKLFDGAASTTEKMA